MKPYVWQTLQLLIIVSPFWFLASNLRDGDEAVKTLVAAAMAGGAQVLGAKFKQTEGG